MTSDTDPEITDASSDSTSPELQLRTINGKVGIDYYLSYSVFEVSEYPSNLILT